MMKGLIKYLLMLGVVLFSACLQLSALAGIFINELQDTGFTSIGSQSNGEQNFYTFTCHREKFKHRLSAILFENEEEDDQITSKKRSEDGNFIAVSTRILASLVTDGKTPLPYLCFSKGTSHRYLLFQVFRI
jgi:hypothetical protein